MSTLEQHCQESLALFGHEYREVHLWLDEFAGSEQYGMRHRRVRHHYNGMREAVKLFGEEVAMVALQHIRSDLKEEGWKESDGFPQDEANYVKMGLF